jgi:hypothetical protein
MGAADLAAGLTAGLERTDRRVRDHLAGQVVADGDVATLAAPMPRLTTQNETVTWRVASSNLAVVSNARSGCWGRILSSRAVVVFVDF